jgi:hypothetical protein
MESIQPIAFSKMVHHNAANVLLPFLEVLRDSRTFLAILNAQAANAISAQPRGNLIGQRRARNHPRQIQAFTFGHRDHKVAADPHRWRRQTMIPKKRLNKIFGLCAS